MNENIKLNLQKYLKTLTVLYVEDDDDIRAQLDQFLNRRLGKVILACDGQDGLQKFSQQHIDIVITDIKMPNMNGLEMASKIKEISPKTPVLVTTAFELPNYLIEAIRIGIDKYAIKPIDTNLLMRDLMECVKQSHAEQQLQLINQLFDDNQEGILITDKSNTIIMVNKVFTELTGYEPTDVIGLTPSLLASNRHDKLFYETMWQEINEKGGWKGEIWDKRKNGDVFPQWMTISTILDDDGQISNYMAIFSNISERKADEERLKYLASHDMLTGLPNRHTLYDLMSLSFANADRNKESVAILFVDLDKFKPINDNYGHHVGDVFLQSIAKKLLSTLRANDTVSRIGGDEFIIILTDATSRKNISATVHKIQMEIGKSMTIEGHKVSVGSSIGISFYPEHGRYAEKLIKHADEAMYKAKEMKDVGYAFYQEN